jgi:hypothetical protein
MITFLNPDKTRMRVATLARVWSSAFVDSHASLSWFKFWWEFLLIWPLISSQLSTIDPCTDVTNPYRVSSRCSLTISVRVQQPLQRKN